MFAKFDDGIPYDDNDENESVEYVA